MSRNIVFEGWLTKSPPNKRIWRTKWRRRWFALRQSGELPGQYFLDYYADRNCRRLKGTINLDLCEQVDAGLHMERAGNGTLDPKLRGSVFTIQTQSRTYHLEAECEDEMEKWVDAICRVCGLRSTEDNSNVIDTYHINITDGSATNERHVCADTTGPYIPISECITGVRAQDQQRAFTFEPSNIVVSTQKTTCDKATETRGQHIYATNPQIKITNADFSENESNISDEDCKSLNASQSNIPDWSVTKSFTKLAVSPSWNESSEEGPPVPPRPPKTFARHRDHIQRETFQGPRIQEPVESVQESIANYTGPGTPWLRVPRRTSHSATPSSPARVTRSYNHHRTTDDEEETSPGHQSMQYCNLSSMPPAVDRALKPRYSNYTPSANSTYKRGSYSAIPPEELRQDALQYLDLDLDNNPPPTKNSRSRRFNSTRGKTMSSVEADSVYKTVDFVKTEALNITRQDAEASRSEQH